MRSSRRGTAALWAAFLMVVLALLARPGTAAAAPGVPTGRWPLAGSPRVLKPFAPPAQRYGRGHRGVDLSARVGEPVLAALAGRVAFAGQVAGRGVVSVDTAGLRMTYEPVAAQVAEGASVRAGQPLGVVGSGGHCSGSCLHWGLRSGTDYLNPLLVVGGRGEVALVAGDRRRAVQRAAAARARLAAVATAGLTTSWVTGPGGRHGFAHPVPGAVTSPFGVRFHPVLHVWKLHDGTDFGAACGTPIRAPAAGVVQQVTTSTGYGRRLLLDHGGVDGRHVVTAYNHAQSYVVRPGQQVARGQLLGHVGSTGYSTGCHLHLMVWLDGRLTNPMTWFSP
jgi:murein DD-endopeptidase MepM/ murein hydrolase activator NlpD